MAELLCGRDISRLTGYRKSVSHCSCHQSHKEDGQRPGMKSLGSVSVPKVFIGMKKEYSGCYAMMAPFGMEVKIGNTLLKHMKSVATYVCHCNYLGEDLMEPVDAPNDLSYFCWVHLLTLCTTKEVQNHNMQNFVTF